MEILVKLSRPRRLRGAVFTRQLPGLDDSGRGEIGDRKL